MQNKKKSNRRFPQEVKEILMKCFKDAYIVDVNTRTLVMNKKITPAEVVQILRDNFSSELADTHYSTDTQIKSFFSRNKNKLNNELQRELIEKSMVDLIKDVENPGQNVRKRSDETTQILRSRKKMKKQNKTNLFQSNS